MITVYLLSSTLVTAEPSIINSNLPVPEHKTYANMVISLSSDGRYAVSSNLNNQIILWDIKKHHYKIISNNGNCYSAYFIKHSHNFMWQSLSKHNFKVGVYYTRPTQDYINQIKKGDLSLITKENKKIYIYYPCTIDGKPSYRRNPFPSSYNANMILKDISNHVDFHFSKLSENIKYKKNLDFRMRYLQVIRTIGYHANNIVHVQNIDGRTLMTFDNFPVYGQVMTTDLKHYFSSTFNWSLFRGWGKHQQMIRFDNGGFYSSKLLNLTLSSDDRFLLTSGYGQNHDPIVHGKNYISGNVNSQLKSKLNGVVTWSVSSGRPLKKYNGLRSIVSIYATISPDNHYIVGGEEAWDGWVWRVNQPNKRMKLLSIFPDNIEEDQDEETRRLNAQLIPVPEDFYCLNYNTTRWQRTTSVKFIDKTHFLRFIDSIPYALLYDTKHPIPIKYLSLKGNILPSINDYTQDEAFDTSPSKHILVIGMIGHRGGILVYHYDPKTMTLKKIWTAFFTYPKKKN